jgi:hypothetical protein
MGNASCCNLDDREKRRRFTNTWAFEGPGHHDWSQTNLVAGTFLHTCAVTSQGQLICFGDNGDGQCDVPQDFGSVAVVAAGYKLLTSSH